jgi:chromosome segregation ATPase
MWSAALPSPLQREQWLNVAPVISDTLTSVLTALSQLSTHLQSTSAASAEAQQAAAARTHALESALAALQARCEASEVRAAALEAAAESEARVAAERMREVCARVESLERALQATRDEHAARVVSERDARTQEQGVLLERAAAMTQAVEQRVERRVSTVEGALERGDYTRALQTALAKTDMRVSTVETQMKPVVQAASVIDAHGKQLDKLTGEARERDQRVDALRAEMRKTSSEQRDEIEGKMTMLVQRVVGGARDELERLVDVQARRIDDVRTDLAATNAHLQQVEEVLNEFEQVHGDRSESAELLRDRMLAEARQRNKLAAELAASRTQIDHELAAFRGEHGSLATRIAEVAESAQRAAEQLRRELVVAEQRARGDLGGLEERVHNLESSPTARLTEARFYALEKRVECEEENRIRQLTQVNQAVVAVARAVDETALERALDAAADAAAPPSTGGAAGGDGSAAAPRGAASTAVAAALASASAAGAPPPPPSDGPLHSALLRRTRTEGSFSPAAPPAAPLAVHASASMVRRRVGSPGAHGAVSSLPRLPQLSRSAGASATGTHPPAASPRSEAEPTPVSPSADGLAMPAMAALPPALPSATPRSLPGSSPRISARGAPVGAALRRASGVQ